MFDVDGVFLSEERCFDASALTVWEMLHHPEYLGLSGENFTPEPDEGTIRRVRREVFAEDRVLDWLKARGINSNWDMVFLTFSCQLLSLLRRLEEIYHAVAETRERLLAFAAEAPWVLAQLDHDLGHRDFEIRWTRELLQQVRAWRPPSR